MAEYIDRKAFIQALAETECDILPADDLDGFTFDCVCKVVDSMPSADVVPVVRCRDCKYRDGTPGQPNILCAQMHEDDFCSYGEREDGKNEK